MFGRVRLISEPTAIGAKRAAQHGAQKVYQHVGQKLAKVALSTRRVCVCVCDSVLGVLEV